MRDYPPPPAAGKPASSWREVSDWINDRGWAIDQNAQRATLVYRGGAASRRLESALLKRGEQYARREDHILGAFRRYAYRSGGVDWSDWEWLALAQHHGLPTRLIDFTFSPLIALHFATLSACDEPGILWAVDYQKVHQYLPAKLRGILEHSDVKLFGTEQLARYCRSLPEFDGMGSKEAVALFWEPPSIDERIVNQSATFCVMSGPTARFDDWLGSHADCGRALMLSPQAKEEARRELDVIGITERLLFPDLTGLARWIARYYS